MNKVAFSIAALLLFASIADARVWTDSTGKYSIEANLIAFNNRMVVLQREDHQLGQVPVEKLSKADQEYLKSKEASESVKQIGGMQTWTLRNGLKMIGRVVGYARKEMVVQRRRGNIYVNERVFDNLPEVYQLMIPKIVAKMENLKRDDKQAL